VPSSRARYVSWRASWQAPAVRIYLIERRVGSGNPDDGIARAVRHAGLVEPFTLPGGFWLPDNPERVVPGELGFQGRSLVFTVFDSLQPFDPAPRPYRPLPITRHHLVHGRLRGVEDVTLVDAWGVDRSVPEGNAIESWHPQVVFRGRHLVETETFDRARVYFDGLPAWAGV
jgi:hypothetical protein